MKKKSKGTTRGFAGADKFMSNFERASKRDSHSFFGNNKSPYEPNLDENDADEYFNLEKGNRIRVRI